MKKRRAAIFQANIIKLMPKTVTCVDHKCRLSQTKSITSGQESKHDRI